MVNYRNMVENSLYITDWEFVTSVKKIRKNSRILQKF